MKLTFIETKTFSRKIHKLWNDLDYAKFRVELAENPAAGDLIPQSGGLRKIRRAAKGHGKSGGFRIIYFWMISRNSVLMLDIYPKNEKEKLSSDEMRRLIRAKRDIFGE